MTGTEAGVVARFFVAGRPRTKGHMKPVPHRRGDGTLAITLHDRDEAREWLQTLIKRIREQAGIVPIVRGKKVIGVQPPWPYDGPVLVDSTFYFERDLSIVNPDGLADLAVIPSHRTPYPTARGLGDRDTLERCLLDALTQSGLLEDDRWVVGGEPRKRWTDPHLADVGEGPRQGPDWSDRAGVWCTVRPAP